MLWVSMSVCEGHMASPTYPDRCGGVCALTSWPVAGAEAEAKGLSFFRIFCGGVCGQGLQESVPRLSWASVVSCLRLN